MTRNETLKIRYQVYRRLGYDSKTARALSQRSLDVSGLEISEKTGKLKQNRTTKQYIEKDMESWKRSKVVDKYKSRSYALTNDTVLSRWGMLTHDKRYKGETGKIISILKNEHNLTTDQAYYFLYTMLQGNMTYKQAKTQLLSNKEFEMYVSKGKRKPLQV